MQNGKLSELHTDFKPLLYNIWNVPKGNETKQFLRHKLQKILDITLMYQLVIIEIN